jgi:alpha-beta hydrolase superfamily lysophospholipase
VIAALARTRTVLCVLALLTVGGWRVSLDSATGRPVGFVAPDGTNLSAVLYEANNRAAPGIVLVHMLGRSKDEWTWIADRLQESGATVLALDLRGHGASGGSPALLAPMVSDVGAALDWLAARPNVRAGALGVVGASLGANLAALAAADRGAVRAVALVSPSLDYRGVRIEAPMRQYGARPALLVASLKDPYAARTVRELSKESPGPREARWAQAAAHGTLLLAAEPDLVRAILEWFQRTLA